MVKLIDSVPERHSEREAIRLAEEKRLKEERERLQEEAERRRNGMFPAEPRVLTKSTKTSFWSITIYI